MSDLHEVTGNLGVELNEIRIDEISRFIMLDPHRLDIADEHERRLEVEKAVDAVFIRAEGHILPEPMREKYIERVLQEMPPPVHSKNMIKGAAANARHIELSLPPRDRD